MTAATATPYDQISYPGRPYESTHPAHLAMLGVLYGMSPASARTMPRARARVRHRRQSAADGLSLSRKANSSASTSHRRDREGPQPCRALRAEQCLAAPRRYCRGRRTGGSSTTSSRMASIPGCRPQCATQMLAIFSRTFTPQGIAYVSYNAHPGSHMRDLVRDIMNFHVPPLNDPKQRIGQARAILEFVSEGSEQGRVYGGVLREQFARPAGMGDEVLFHDDLNGRSRSVPAARGRRLTRRRTDCSISATRISRGVISRNISEQVQKRARGLPRRTSSWRAISIQDFVDGHGFRRTLLCHGDIKLERVLDARLLTRFHLPAPRDPVDPAMDPNAVGGSNSRSKPAKSLETDHPLTKAAIRDLGRCWPGAVAIGSWSPVRWRRLIGACCRHRTERQIAGNDQRSVQGRLQRLYQVTCRAVADRR